MKNNPIGVLEARDLRSQVQKLLRGLGNPQPPLDLREVRELLRLDRHFYSATDTGFLREMVSKVKVGFKQLALRPSLLLDVVRKASLHALYVPDKKRILISSEVPEAKQRWAETHEIGHGIAPWHQEFLHGDNEETLSRQCHEKLEAEANFAAGQILFFEGRFREEASDSAPSLDQVLALAKLYGNSNASTLWRFVEEAHPSLPMVGIIFPHPPRDSSVVNLTSPEVHCIESPTFRERFAGITEGVLISRVMGYLERRRGGPMGRSEQSLEDVNGDCHWFRFESWSNTHQVLTLGVHEKPARSQAS